MLLWGHQSFSLSYGRFLLGSMDRSVSWPLRPVCNFEVSLPGKKPGLPLLWLRCVLAKMRGAGARA